jgi:serine/threonine protein kinase
MDNPEGIRIHRQWKIGKLLGSGACGSVHELVRNESNSNQQQSQSQQQKSNDQDKIKFPLVIKLSRLPNSQMSKREHKNCKLLADMLHYEGLLYHNQLIQLQGTFLPRTPLRPVTGDQDGYRFLILERMAHPFYPTIPSQIMSGGRTFASVAVHLVSLVQAIHNCKLLILDMKPENFMVHESGTIVLLDLGMMQSYATMSGHRPNTAFNTTPITTTSAKSIGVGTPLYSSLQRSTTDEATPSRRDDMESLFYLLMELILSLMAEGQPLPWHNGQSDMEIQLLKQQACDTSTKHSPSSIWNSFDASTGRILKELYIYIRGLSYMETPDYNRIQTALSNLSIVPPSPAPRRGRRLATTNENVRVVKAKNSNVKHVTQTTKELSKSSIVREEKINPVEDDYYTCAEDAMDWEIIEDPKGVTVSIASGPHTGDVCHLLEGQCESVTLGSEMGRKHEKGYLFVCDDDNIDKEHARITLQMKRKKMITLIVQDMKSKSGTFVGQMRIPNGKTQTVFLNDTLRLGDVQITILPWKSRTAASSSSLSTNPVTNDHQRIVNSKTRIPKTILSSSANQGRIDENVIVQSAKVPSQPRGFRVDFTLGPHKGKSILLQEGCTECVALGQQLAIANDIPSFSLEDMSRVLYLHLDTTQKSYCRVQLKMDTKKRSKQQQHTPIGLNGNALSNNAIAFANDTITIGDTTKIVLQPL